jgi:hypothetical protein
MKSYACIVGDLQRAGKLTSSALGTFPSGPES